MLWAGNSLDKAQAIFNAEISGGRASGSRSGSGTLNQK
jgi:hypothetical protein